MEGSLTIADEEKLTRLPQGEIIIFIPNCVGEFCDHPLPRKNNRIIYGDDDTDNCFPFPN